VIFSSLEIRGEIPEIFEDLDLKTSLIITSDGLKIQLNMTFKSGEAMHDKLETLKRPA
jgi:hypothetical protein